MYTGTTSNSQKGMHALSAIMRTGTPAIPAPTKANNKTIAVAAKEKLKSNFFNKLFLIGFPADRRFYFTIRTV